MAGARPNYYRRKKEVDTSEREVAPGLCEWELDLYRLLIANGEWHNLDFLFPRASPLVPLPLFNVLVKAGRKKEPMAIDDVELSEETKTLLEQRAGAGCVCCRYIMDDWKTNNKLTDYGNFPAEAKIAHIEAEKAGQV